MTRLESTRVLVTGGTSGLGRAMAAALADAGARVALTSREATRAHQAAAQIGAVGLAMDVRDEQSVQTGVGAVYDELGGLDVLVANAGIGMRTVNPRFLTDPQSFWEVAPTGFRDVVETKVTGTFLVARAVAPRMLAAGGGRIVVISMNEQTMTRRG
ncbi:MAG TPA: SDR family NAD(P)-dependent oxidoreductase, partial [Solirubrobacteraceae bacterium]